MFVFDSEKYDLHVYDLDGDFYVTFSLNLEFSYRAFM